MENLAEENYPREFNLIEVLSIAWNIFSKNYFKLFGFIFAIAFPMAIINTMIVKPKMTALSLQIEALKSNPPALIEFLLNWNDLQTSMLFALVSILSLTLVAIISKAVNSILYETEFNSSSIVMATLKHFPIVLLTALLLGLMSIVGLFFIIIPGILVYVYYYFAIISCATESKGIFQSLMNSYNLVKGRFLMTFVFILFFFLLGLIVSSVLSIIGQNITSQYINIMIELISGIASTYFIVAHYVLFVNYRDTAHLYAPRIIQE